MVKLDKEFISFVFGNIYSNGDNVLTGDEHSMTIKPGDTLYITPKRNIYSVIFEFDHLSEGILYDPDGVTYSLRNASFIGRIKE